MPSQLFIQQAREAEVTANIKATAAHRAKQKSAKLSNSTKLGSGGGGGASGAARGGTDAAKAGTGARKGAGN